MEEFKLIKLANNGDVSAFENLILPHEKKVYNIALGICKNEQDAYDISQEVFLKVYKNLSSFSYNSTFSTWLYRIVKNTAIDYLRKENRIRQNQSSEELSPELVDSEKTALEKIVEEEDASFLRHYLDKLDETDRSILIFREVEGQTYEELSKVFDVKIGTVKSRIFRAKKKLRELIEKDREQI